MAIKKAVRKIHLWLGLASGLVVLVLGITGCIFCFQKELKDLFYADRMYVNSPVGTSLPLDVLKANAQAALGDQYPISFIEYRPNSNKTVQFRASKSNEDAITYNAAVIYNKTVYVNSYTGQVQAIENTKWEFFTVVLQLHYNLLLNKIGHRIVGWSTVVFVLLLITGLVLWWPKNRAAVKQRLWFKWKRATRFKRKNYDLHNVPGFYSLLFALIISLTGLFFAFDWFNNSVRWIANGGKAVVQLPPVKSDSTQPASANVIDAALSNAYTQSAHAPFYFVSLPEKADAPYVVTAMHNANNYVRRSQFYYDRNTGKLLRARPYEKQASGDKFSLMVYDLHVGKVLGLPTQILAFIASLIVASLPVTGFIIWLGRRKKEKFLVRQNVPRERVDA